MNYTSSRLSIDSTGDFLTRLVSVITGKFTAPLHPAITVLVHPCTLKEFPVETIS